MRGADQSRQAGTADGAGRPAGPTSDQRARDYQVLADQSPDDTDRGWGEPPSSNDDRLLADRPPHWG